MLQRVRIATTRMKYCHRIRPYLHCTSPASLKHAAAVMIRKLLMWKPAFMGKPRAPENAMRQSAPIVIRNTGLRL